MKRPLTWPLEAHRTAESRWSHAGSNLCLDFHGDPAKAELVVFSDGNHHMALEASLQAFSAQHASLEILYATTPPAVILQLLKNGEIWLGNLCLSVRPHAFISPANILQGLQQDGFIHSHQVFMQSRGNVLLVKKGNPKNIQTIDDILRDDVRLFISNPETEKASHVVYRESLCVMSASADAMQRKIDNHHQTVYGEVIHHREAPQCITDGDADVAMVYYHLALRYTRIFPDTFEMIDLGVAAGQSSPDNVVSQYHIGLLPAPGKWGQSFYDFMLSDQVSEIYQQHGLTRPK